ncbi:MAG: hypothetical protein EAZ37_17625 [Burkholderiales bacterium]|nr:MAG: hypothetical protein EAZ37_17625 [Burkholderiales bacterium]
MMSPSKPNRGAPVAVTESGQFDACANAAAEMVVAAAIAMQCAMNQRRGLRVDKKNRELIVINTDLENWGTGAVRTTTQGVAHCAIESASLRKHISEL